MVAPSDNILTNNFPFIDKLAFIVDWFLGPDIKQNRTAGGSALITASPPVSDQMEHSGWTLF